MYSALAGHVQMQTADIEDIESVIHFTLTQTKSSRVVVSLKKKGQLNFWIFVQSSADTTVCVGK